MTIKQNEIWVADLNSQIGTETGKTRPVVIVQTDLLNKALHPSTIICPITTNVKSERKHNDCIGHLTQINAAADALGAGAFIQ